MITTNFEPKIDKAKEMLELKSTFLIFEK